MVEVTWSVDRQKAQKAKKAEIQAERLRQFEILKKLPEFTVERIVSNFHPITREPYDHVTMQSGDLYEGPRKDVEELIGWDITQKVDQVLGLRVTFLFCS